ncbi:hypothetical protein [Pseudokineococcus lusitanus]|uniref:Uncharacterized protein n=1 Tax=Pseudokineococcus lusitanus TaxID=763993 RepID=A0A3N1G9C1_9ACTN|nr:hypothetical protein [Pseudokineococcus lusitanus]ROP26823.1 hypothetical protein EDC03_3060 [Pseudokineococcus lusitanus]
MSSRPSTATARPTAAALPRQRGAAPVGDRGEVPSASPSPVPTRRVLAPTRDDALVGLLVGVPAVALSALVGSAGGALDATTPATAALGAGVPTPLAAGAGGAVLHGLAVAALVAAAVRGHRLLARRRPPAVALAVPPLVAAPVVGLLAADPVLALLAGLLAAAALAGRAAVAGALVGLAVLVAPVPGAVVALLVAARHGRRASVRRTATAVLVPPAVALAVRAVVVGLASRGAAPAPAPVDQLGPLAAAAGFLTALLPSPATAGVVLAVVLAVGAAVAVGRVRLLLAGAAATSGLAAGLLAG